MSISFNKVVRRKRKFTIAATATAAMARDEPIPLHRDRYLTHAKKPNDQRLAYRLDLRLRFKDRKMVEEGIIPQRNSYWAA